MNDCIILGSRLQKQFRAIILYRLQKQFYDYTFDRLQKQKWPGYKNKNGPVTKRVTKRERETRPLRVTKTDRVWEGSSDYGLQKYLFVINTGTVVFLRIIFI